ncbi:hypothetical protein TRVA0_001S06172 [Trichomonascus vanleenenianus]|uniref:uncharacterized protein n=1 Tax=Trichomonascus vanleenenianus TaxID=2268995 RepID=UPI003EC95784
MAARHMHNPSSGSSHSSSSSSSIFGKPQSSSQEHAVISGDALEGEPSESRALSEFRRQYLKLLNDWKASNKRFLERYHDIQKDARLALDNDELDLIEKDRMSIVDELKTVAGLHNLDEEASVDDQAVKRKPSPDIADESMKKRRSYVW